MKIVVLDGYTENPGDLSWEGFQNLGELTVYDRTDPMDVIARIGDSEIVIVNKTVLTAEIFEACPTVKYVGVLATGYNVVDVDAAKKYGIVVCNIPTYGTSAVAQFVFALLLEICHKVQVHNDSVRALEWTNCPDFSYWKSPLKELLGKTIGIVGFGRIGRNTAQIAKAFGMHVLAYDQYETEDGRVFGEYVTLDELLAKSDVISLHCPLFKETEGIINKENIAKMKDGVIIINTSRGPLIKEDDLAEALKSGKVYAAGLDVVSVEPIREDNVLLSCENCLITPHIAWAPLESRGRLMDIAVDNLKHFLNGDVINQVNA